MSLFSSLRDGNCPRDRRRSRKARDGANDARRTPPRPARVLNISSLEVLESRQLLTAIVWTDQPDYAPGSTALITATTDGRPGPDFLAGESVKFQVTRTDGIEDFPGGNLPWYVTDGGDGDGDGEANGIIRTSWFVEEQYAGAALLLTATGQGSGASATYAFTDSVVSVQILSPASFEGIVTRTLPVTITVVSQYSANNSGTPNSVTVRTNILRSGTGNTVASAQSSALPIAVANRQVQQPVTLPSSLSDGYYDVQVIASQGITALTATSFSAILVDRSAPFSFASVTAGFMGSNGWYRSPVTLALSAFDNVSGVANVFFRLDGGPTQSGSSVTVADDGIHNIEYWSVDRAGNVESAKTFQLPIDQTGPVVTWGTPVPTPAPNANGWYHDDVTMFYTATDATSGPSSQIGAITFTGEGIGLSGTIFSFDVAGNFSSSSSPSVNIDRRAPDTGIVAAPANPTSGSTATFQFASTDPADSSGINRFEYRLNGGSWISTVVDGVTLASISGGSNTLEVRAVDNADNVDPTPASYTWAVTADQSIDFGALGDRVYGDPDFTVGATASSGLPVTFTVLDGPATITGSTIHLTGAGVVTVRATQAGGDSFNAAAPVDRLFTVARAILSGSFTASSKVYDGSATATIASRSLGGVMVSDVGDVTLTGGAAMFSDKDAAGGKQVTGTGFALAGSAAGNYVLASSTLTASADITARGLSASLAPQTKPYDGSSGATLAPTDFFLSGLVDTDAFTVTRTSGAYSIASVGSGVISASLAAGDFTAAPGTLAGNYTLPTSAIGPGQITPRVLTPSVVANDKTYDGGTTATLSNLSVGGVIPAEAGEVLLTAAAAHFDTAGAGTGKTVTATGLGLGGAAAGNYTLGATTSVTTTADIHKATPMVQVTNDGGAYNNSAFGATAATATGVGSTTLAGFGDPALTYRYYDGTLTTASQVGAAIERAGGAPKDAGSYTVVAHYASADPNYASADSAPVNFTIDARAVTVTPTAGQGKVYGDADPAAPGFSITAGSLAIGDAFAGSLSRAAGEHVGSYAIGQGSLALSSNYVLTVAPGAEFAITPRPIAVTADPQTKVYGTGDPDLSYRVTSGTLVVGDGFSGVLSRAGDEHVGDRPILRGTLGLGTDYSLTYVGAVLTITPATLNVTADPSSRIYGGANPEFSASYSGFVNGDTASSLSGSPSLTTAADPSSPVGDYTIAAAPGSLANADYTYAFVSGTLTVTRALLLVTAGDLTKTYGQEVSLAGAQFTTSGLVNGDQVAVVTLASVGAAATATVAGSPYAITASSATGTGLGNYTISYVAGTLTVERAELTITADDKARVYGDANPVLTGSIVGIRNGDAVSATYATSAGASDPVGLYAIIPTAVDDAELKLSNYNVHLVDGSLSVTPATLDIVATDASRAYGDANPAFAGTYSGQKNGETFTVTASTAATQASGVGIYAITPSAAGATLANYTVAAHAGMLAINPATLNVTADDLQKTYGTANPTLTASYGGFRNGETLASSGISGAPDLSTTATDGSRVGTYTIAAAQGGLTASNYVFAFGHGTLTVAPRALTVTAVANSKVYDATTGAAATPMITQGTLFGTDSANFSEEYDTKDVGVGKTLTPSGSVDDGNGGHNYSVTFVAGAGTVTAASLLVTGITAMDKVYDGTSVASLSTGAGTLTGRFGDDAVNLSVSAAAGVFADKNVGHGKSVLVSGLALAGADAANYVVTQPTITASINPLAITGGVTASDKVYDGTVAASIASRTLTGPIPGDDVSYAGGSASFSDKNAGLGKTVTATGLTLTGADAANYAVNSTATTAANVTPLAVTGSITASDKTYDGTTAATISGYSLSGKLAGDDARYAGGAAAFAGKDAGTGKAVTADGLGLEGVDAGNYTVNATATATANITTRALTISAIGQDKVYDGTPAATVSLSDNRVAGDVLGISYASAAFPDKNVGTARTVSVGGISVAGVDAGNYTFNSTASTTAKILARPLTVMAEPRTKPYGQADPTLTYRVTAGAPAPGDSFTGGLARAAGEAPGTYAIGQGTLTLGSNYALAYIGANLTITTAATTVVLTSSWPAPVVGQPITFTAAVAPATALTLAGVRTPTGSVTFTRVDPTTGQAVALGTVALDATGHASLSIGSLTPAGTHAVTADYGGNGDFNASTGTISQVVKPVTVSNLQAVLDAIQLTGGSLTLAMVPGQSLDTILQAINGLTSPSPSSPVTVRVDLGGATYSTNTHVATHEGVTVVVANGTLAGSSSALIVDSGAAVLDGVTAGGNGNASTIVVNGGGLKLRDSTVQESTRSIQAAILVDGGTVDLGTAADPGGNTLNVNGLGLLIADLGTNPTPAVGNAFQLNSVVVSSLFRVEDLILDALELPGAGLVTLVPNNVYVSAVLGSIQRAVDAIAPGGTVNVEGKGDGDYTVGAKPLTVTFQDGSRLVMHADPLAPGTTELVVTGTAGDDSIRWQTGRRSGEVVVRMNDLPEATFTPTGRLVGHGLAGDDDLRIQGSIALPAWLFGDEGDDVIQAGDGAAIVLGGPGDDVIQAGKGRGILIGGVGADKILGKGGDDIMIGGTTAHDLDDAALAAILAEWSRSGATYAQRVARVQAGVGPGGIYRLTEQTVVDDGVADELDGGSGMDWFFASLDAPDRRKRDKVSGSNGVETITRIP